jgi:hypothetical protein
MGRMNGEDFIFRRVTSAENHGPGGREKRGESPVARVEWQVIRLRVRRGERLRRDWRRAAGGGVSVELRLLRYLMFKKSGCSGW